MLFFNDENLVDMLVANLAEFGRVILFPHTDDRLTLLILSSGTQDRISLKKSQNRFYSIIIYPPNSLYYTITSMYAEK